MSCCNHCQDAGGCFGKRTARRELRRFRRRGPARTTRILLDEIRTVAPVEGATLLDVGGGIGAIPLELLGSGLRSAVQVDASPAYLEVARTAAREDGVEDRMTWHFGDFVELAPEVEPADVVTLDRVICCYPHLDQLVEAAMGRALQVVGLVYPRARWGTRVALALGNLWFRIRGSAFRVYLHDPDRVRRLMRAGGLGCASSHRTFIWHVEVFQRVPERSGVADADP